MRFSEALRLGIGVVENNTKLYLVQEGENWQGCALGTAGYAVGLRAVMNEYDKNLHQAFPILSWMKPEHSCYGGIHLLAITISAYHYTKRMTREQIADWVETLEPIFEAEQAKLKGGEPYNEEGHTVEPTPVIGSVVDSVL